MPKTSPPPPIDRVASSLHDDLQAFTVEEVAQRLRLSPDTIYARIAEGRLGHIRDGEGPKAPIRVLPSQLRAYLDAARVDTI